MSHVSYKHAAPKSFIEQDPPQILSQTLPPSHYFSHSLLKAPAHHAVVWLQMLLWSQCPIIASLLVCERSLNLARQTQMCVARLVHNCVKTFFHHRKDYGTLLYSVICSHKDAQSFQKTSFYLWFGWPTFFWEKADCSVDPHRYRYRKSFDSVLRQSLAMRSRKTLTVEVFSLICPSLTECHYFLPMLVTNYHKIVIMLYDVKNHVSSGKKRGTFMMVTILKTWQGQVWQIKGIYWQTWNIYFH